MSKGIFRWVGQNLFALSAVIVAIANLWLFSRLAPFQEDLAVMKIKVSAVENRQERLTELIDRIDTKLDNLMIQCK